MLPVRPSAGGDRLTSALFNPLRRRIQHAVDRRFNRARYDAEATVAMFAIRLKDALDLDSVRDDLTSVVQQALEPDRISIWSVNELDPPAPGRVPGAAPAR